MLQQLDERYQEWSEWSLLLNLTQHEKAHQVKIDSLFLMWDSEQQGRTGKDCTCTHTWVVGPGKMARGLHTQAKLQVVR